MQFCFPVLIILPGTDLFVQLLSALVYLLTNRLSITCFLGLRPRSGGISSLFRLSIVVLGVTVTSSIRAVREISTRCVDYHVVHPKLGKPLSVSCSGRGPPVLSPVPQKHMNGKS